MRRAETPQSTVNLANPVAELNDQQKLRIVMALARFETNAEIIKDFAADGITLESVQVGRYDPTKAYFDAGEKWRKPFEEERQRYMTEVQSVPIANQGFRLNALQKAYELAVKRGNLVLGGQILKQAAEEVGGSFTNERNVNISKTPLQELTAEERRAMFEELIAKALEGGDPAGAQPAPKTVQ